MPEILVVDDHPATRDLVRSLLEYKGHSVRVAENGVQALDAAAAREPDLVIADVVMPEMDGFTFVRELRGRLQCRQTPVILMSASLNAERAAAVAKGNGVKEYLVKPVEPDTLLQAVERVLAQPESVAPPPGMAADLHELFAESLSDKVQELERLNTDLERRVTERTAELARANEQLLELAIRDPLTGLFNRRYLEETLTRELRRCRRDAAPLAVSLLDVDHFKRINDEGGHAAGDEVLRKIGEVLSQSLRSGDVACRYGGEEFVVVLPGASAEVALRRVEAIRALIATRSATLGGRRIVRVTVSAGVSVSPLHGIDTAALLGAADHALYRAKQAGRDRAEVYA